MSTTTKRPDTIHVQGAPFTCIIGVYDEERHTPQALVVDLTFEVDVQRAATSGLLAHTVDYARVLGEVGFVLESARFELIETAAEALAATLLSGLDATSGLALTLHKPGALLGAGVPSLHIERQRDQAAVWSYVFGTVEVPWRDSQLGIHRVRVRPGGEVQLPQPVPAFSCDAGRRGEALGAVGRLSNSGTGWATYLLCSHPALPLDAFGKARTTPPSAAPPPR
jgi:dihydroneopterin aldolase